MNHLRKQASRAHQRVPLRQQARFDDALFQMAFHKSPALQSVVRATDGVVVEANDTFLQKFGRTRDQVIGKTPFELGSWVEPEKLEEYRRELETKGCVQGREVRLRANDGKIFTVLLSSHPVKIGGSSRWLRSECEQALQGMIDGRAR